jgi:hypothetical protein
VISLLTWAVFVSLGIPGVVLAVRKLPGVDTKVLAGVKPWACDVCMCFWVGAILTLEAAAVAWDLRVLAVAPPAYTLALLLLRVMQAPHGAPPPPDLPEES